MATITKGSGNVFADIGSPDAETHQLKAELVRRIGLLVEAAGLTQAEAAEHMGMTQPDVSKMLKGQFRPISIERLMRCVVALGQDVTIDIGSPRDKSSKPEIRVIDTRARKRRRELTTT